MKILQVISYFSPKFGGDFYICVGLSRFLNKIGHDVTIITTDYGIDEITVKSLLGDGIKIKIMKSIFNIGFFIYSPEIIKWSKLHIEDFDIIHIHNSRSYQTSSICKYAHLRNVPYVIQAHGCVGIDSGKENLKKIYDIAWGNSVLLNSSAVIALTNIEYKQYLKRGIVDKKIYIIPNFLDIIQYLPNPIKGSFRNKIGVDNDAKLILYLGRMHESKGIDLLIYSFSIIHNIINNSRLIIIGPDHGYRNKIEKLIINLGLTDSVIIFNFVKNHEKNEAFNDSTVFVTPMYKGFPVTFLESMFFSKPIITTTNGDKLDWITEVGIVSDYNPDSLANSILRLLEDPKFYKEKQDNCNKLIKNNFILEVIGYKYEELYNKLL